MVRTQMNQFIEQIYKNADAYSGKTVFIDRDGTLNKEINYLSDPSQIDLLPGVINGIKELNRHNIVVIVVTNQPVIARGLITIDEEMLINDELVTLLGNKQAYINAIYFCPHHPERNHSDIPASAMKYRIVCKCRKPNIAMFKKAMKDFHVNVASAYIVGDRTADIQAGKNLGITTILVKTGSAGSDNTYSIVPDYVADDLQHAADIIINHA